MTEKAAGADATGMQTSAVLDGDEWVLNGEKWFSSSASVADIAVVMAKTDPDAPRHERYSTFIVELAESGLPDSAQHRDHAAPHRTRTEARRLPLRNQDRQPAGAPATTYSAAAARVSTWASTAWLMDACGMGCTTWRWRSGRST